MGKAQVILLFETEQRLAGGTHQPGIEQIDLLRQAGVDSDAKQATFQRLRQVNIELIGQPLLIAKVHPGEGAKAFNGAVNSFP